MIDVKVDVSGIEDLIARLGGSNGDIAKVAEDLAEEVFVEADKRVPRDTGALAESGRVEKRKDGFAVVYGDKDAPYALDVHENPSVQPTSGSKRWLRDAAMESSRKLLRIAAARLSKTISE